jgi:hypothetical protein
MKKLFVSHSSQDDAFVRELQQALGDLAQDVWIDSREFRGGDPLWPEIQQAIEDASAFAVVVSTDALQSKWVGKELRHALDVQKQRGRDTFPVIPLSLNGTKLGVLEEFFGEEPIYISVSSDAGGAEAALNAILVALGKRLPADVAATSQPKAQPLEELVLELTDLKFHEQDGVRRGSAHARLVYEPAAPGQEDVHSAHRWRFIAPIGPIEAEELRWYLEKYAIWPSDYFRDRARKVEENLVKWGQLLYEAAMPVAHTANVMNAWARIDGHAGRRFSVEVDATLEAGASSTDVDAARESATLLLGVCRGSFSMTATASSSRARSQHASAGVCRVPESSTSPSSPHPFASSSLPRGRRTMPVATSIIAPARCRWSRPWRRWAASSSSTFSPHPR